MRDWGGGGIVTHRAPFIHGYSLRMKPPSAFADSRRVARNRLEPRHCLGREHACSVGRLDPRMADAEWVTNPPPPTDGCRVREPIEHPIFADVRGGIGRGRMIRPRRRRPTSPNWSSSRTSSHTTSAGIRSISDRPGHRGWVGHEPATTRRRTHPRATRGGSALSAGIGSQLGRR